MNKKQIIWVLFAFLAALIVLVVGTRPYSVYANMLGIKTNAKNPKELYRVYLGGESLGVIESKKDLENYIDKKQEKLKEKYNVDKVYAPNDLKIVKELTYNETVSTSEEIYNKLEKIRGTSSFTIDGYKIYIEGIDKKHEDGTTEKIKDQTIYVLNKELFETAVNKTILAFIPEEEYDNYINDKQKPLEENKTGSIINNLTIENKIKITKGRIPAEDKIFTTEEELSQYLLFGTNETQKEYAVATGDTITEIAENNKLSVEEFLIANPSFKSATDLLYPGQVVNLGLINPQFNIKEDKVVVYEQTINRGTTYKNDDTKYVGYEQVEEQGSDGLALITAKREYVNGELKDEIQPSKVTLVPAVNKVVIRGTKKQASTPWGSDGSEYVVPVGIGSWVWPTNAPYTISSGFAWRWGKHHDAIDITGPGHGSPIKAANNGVVVESYYNSYNGNVITVKHSNNYYTMYVHLAARYKKPGDVVMANDVIGTMGMTGFATGVHLHFGVYVGYPFRAGSYAIDPMRLYR